MTNSFNAKTTLTVADRDYEIFKLDAVSNSARLPYSLKILLENLLRHEDGITVTADDIAYFSTWNAQANRIKKSNTARREC